MKNIAINGMGVIGRTLLKTLFETNSDNKVVLINDPYITAKNLVYLLKHDSIYHNWNVEVSNSVKDDKDIILINGHEIVFTHETDANNVPLSEYDVETVVECTGTITGEELEKGGAKYALAAYYAKWGIPIVPEINGNNISVDNKYYCLPDAEVQAATYFLEKINKTFGVSQCVADVFQAYTNAQNTIDSFVDGEDYQIGKAGAWNIVPATTEIKTVGYVLPELNGKVAGQAFRAPVIDGGALVLNIETKNAVTAQEVNELAKSSASTLYGYEDDVVCTSDLVGTEQYVFIAGLTTTLDDTHLSVTIMYDNVKAYCASIISALNLIAVVQ